MIDPAGSGRAALDWRAVGRAQFELTRGARILLVAGHDPGSTANVALGLALAAAEHSSVTLVDAWGDLPEIGVMVAGDDPHGIADCIAFGASFARLQRPVSGVSTLRVVKSGTDDVAQESIMRSPRWDAILSAARAAGVTTLLACRARTPGLDELARQTDGVVLVEGRGGNAGLSNVISVASLRSARPKDEGIAERTPAVAAVAQPARQRVHVAPLLLVLVVVITGAAIAILASTRETSPRTAAEGAPAVGVPRPISASAADSPTRAAPAIANPSDSSRAAAYAVEIAVLNTRAGAQMRLEELRGIPGSTLTPVISNSGDEWYRVFAGALSTPEAADSLRRALAERGIVPSEGSGVVKVWLALRLAAYLPHEELTAESDLLHYISRGIPAYLLVQDDHSLVIFAGAFETTEQAARISALCAGLGIPTRLAYRTGR